MRAVSQGNGATRKVLWRFEGDAFGTAQATNPTATVLTVPLRMPGQYFDSEVGTSYNYFRDYDASTGRYVESDPIGLNGGLNTYVYVGASPLSVIDRQGLFIGVDDAAEALAFCALRPPLCAAVAVATGQALANLGHAIGGVFSKNDDAKPEPDKGESCPARPEFDWNDPTVPPVGSDGKPWPWRGPDAPGGSRGGYVNPNNPDQSAHPDLNHPDPVGPHWDFTDRKSGGWRVYPDGSVRPK